TRRDAAVDGARVERHERELGGDEDERAGGEHDTQQDEQPVGDHARSPTGSVWPLSMEAHTLTGVDDGGTGASRVPAQGCATVVRMSDRATPSGGDEARR